MPDLGTKVNKRLVIALVVVLAIVIIAIALGVYYGGKKDNDDDEQTMAQAIRAECTSKLLKHKDCDGIVGLLEIEKHMKNKTEKCASARVARSQLFPQCFASQNLPEKCANLTDVVWDRLFALYKPDGHVDSELDECEGYQVNHCDALDITIPYKCYTQYRSNGGCRVKTCINDMAQDPPGCSASDLDPDDAYQRLETVYGSMLYCASQDMKECGVGVFSIAKKLCSRPWFAWKFLLKEEQKCSVYESFLVCTAYEMVVSGVDYCGFQTLHESILADASKSGDNPNVCGDAAAKFRDLNQKFPTSREDVCNNTFFHYAAFKGHCSPDPDLFTGNSDRDKCMSEIDRKYCMLGFFGEAKLSCTHETVRETSTDPEVRTGIFDLDPGCEDGYPCVLSTLKLATDARFHNACIENLVEFSSLSDMTVDVDNSLAKGSVTDKMKCRVWDVFGACALKFSPTSCKSSSADVQSGLKMLVDTSAIQTFDDCPDFSPSDSVCPENDTLIYSAIANCGFRAVKLQRDQGNVTDVCESFNNCSTDLKDTYTECSDIDAYFNALRSDDATDYISTILGIYC